MKGAKITFDLIYLFSFFYPATHSCLLFHSNYHPPPIHPLFLFLPFSHPSVTTYTSLTHFKFVHLSLSLTSQTPAHFVCLPISVCSSYKHSQCPASSLTPLHRQSPAQHLFCLSTSWVDGIKCLSCIPLSIYSSIYENFCT